MRWEKNDNWKNYHEVSIADYQHALWSYKLPCEKKLASYSHLQVYHHNIKEVKSHNEIQSNEENLVFRFEQPINGSIGIVYNTSI
jgi:hypothetical protein